MNPTTTPVKVYISYDLADDEKLEILVKQMAMLRRLKKVELWYRKIASAGIAIESEASLEINSADVILFLISPDFLNSDTCYQEAEDIALSLYQSRKTKLVPIYLRPCDFKRTRLYEFEAMLSKDRPIIDYIRKKNADQPFADIVDKIWELVEELEKAKSVTPLAPPLYPDFNLEPPPELESLSPEPEENDSPIALTSLEPTIVIPAETLLPVPILPEYFLPREEELAGLLDMLLGTDGAVAITGVQGMGGIGKSVLAAAVALDERVKARFPDGIFWLVVGQTPDLISLQSSLALALGDKSAITSVEEGKALLRKLLENKTCLLVLDDVWKPEHTQALALTGATGKTLVTTRKEEVVTGLGAGYYPLDKMSPVQAVGLLARAALTTSAQLPQAMAEEIALECGYLPLALSIAGAMAYEQGHDWEYVLTKLKESGLEGVFRSIEVSLNDQPDLTGYYVDLAVFQEDTEIPLEALEALWGLGRQETEEIAIRLGHASLVRWQAGYTRLTLHDLQYDYVRLKRQGELPALHRRLVEGYRKACGGVWWHGQNDRYYYEKICWHIRESGLGTELRGLLLDYRWMAEKLEVSGITELLGDYQYMLVDEEAKLVRDTLELSAHVLAEDSGQLGTQLYGRLLSFRGIPSLQTLLVQLEVELTKPWLRPLHPHLASAGGTLKRTLEGHSSGVTSVAFSPDGKYALSGSNDKTLKLWDWQRGEVIHTLVDHRNGVTSVAFSPDGEHALSGSADNTLKLWDWRKGELIRTMEGHIYWVNAVVFSPNGKYALSGSNDNTLKLWDWRKGELIRTMEGHSSRVNAIAFSPDGEYALSASGDFTGSDNTMKLWDWRKGKLIRTMEGHSDMVFSVAFSPDGEYALSASEDNTLKLWDWQKGELIRTLEGHSSGVTSVAFSPDGKYALSGSNDKTLKLWDWQREELIRTMEGHSSGVTSVAFSPDGKYALSSSYDNTMKLWDWRKGELICTMEDHIYGVNAVAFSPDGEYALSSSYDNTMKLWDWRKGELICTMEDHIYGVNAVAFSPDGKYALSASEDKTLKLWDWERGELIRTLEGHSLPVNAVAFSPNGKYALSASEDKTLKLWDWQKGELIRTMEDDSYGLNAVVFSPDGKYALSDSWFNSLKLWDWQKGELIRTLYGYSDNRINAVAFSPNGKYALSASGDKTLKLWDWQKGEVLASFILESPAFSCAFSRDGQFIMAGDAAGQVYFFKLEL